MKSRWKTYLLYTSLIIIGGGLLFILAETIKAKNTGFETKTLWDWMELLIIPLVLAIGAFFLQRSERAVERETAEKRADLEREIAKDHQQEAALQAYLDHMSELLLKEKLRTTENQEVRGVARTRTVSVMRVLDTKRNDLVIQFLREAKLVIDENSILNGAFMEGMNLQGLYLAHVFLQGAILDEANLQGAILDEADLQGANLGDANMQEASLQSANLALADLWGANLQEAILGGANMQKASLQSANLTLAKMLDVDLREANLLEAELKLASLKGARITYEQLADVKSLKGATLPDGKIHD